jgi:rubrerythrin
VRGKIDARCIGLPEAPKTEHLAEFKSSNTKNFKLLAKDGNVKEAKPAHYVQCQLGMHALGLTRALYLVVNKDDETLHQERLEYDAAYCAKMLARAEAHHQRDATRRPRISEKSDFYLCGMCKHWAVCHTIASRA